MFDLKVINSVLGELEEVRGIPRASIIEAIEMALATAYKREYGKKGQIIRTTFDPQTGDTHFFQVKIVVDGSRVIFDEEKGRTLDTDSQGSTLKEEDIVTVTGISKGKGFQGVVKRHKFQGGRRSHGQKHSEREAGSIGGGGRAGGRVIKGMRMAGRMGGERVTVKNLKVIKVLPKTREVFIRGAIPGRRGSIVEIKKV